MPVVLSKVDCANVDTVITITESSIISYSGSASSAGYVTPPGGTPIRITGSYEALVAGDYVLSIQGSCDVGDITIEPVAAIPVAIDLSTLPGADCGNPSNVSLCELNDLLAALTAIQTAIENQQDFEIITSSWICDDTGTGNWIRTVTPYIDGVAGTVQTVNSGIPCSEPQPLDFEIRTLCDPITGTVHLQTVSVAQDGTITIVDDLDTLEVCNESTQTIQCWKDKFIEGGLDNTFTRYEHTNQNFSITFDNGDVESFDIASATGWTDQVNQMAVGLSGLMPYAQTVDPFCTTGCGGLPVPFVELNQMAWRYVGFRVCPGDRVPVSAVYTSDQATKPVNLVLQYIETDTIYIDRCISCDGVESFLVDGAPYTPVCAIPCVEEFPDLPQPVCNIEYLDGCDNIGQTDPLNFVQIVRAITDCGDGPSVQYLIQEPIDNTLIPYTLVGEFVDCDSGELVPVDEPCLQPIGDCRCLGVGTAGDASYTYINADNTTDIGYSNNATTIKWSIGLGQEADADGTGPYIAGCIAAGNVAEMTIADSEGNITIFRADTVISDGTASGGWAFTGVGGASFNGKVISVVINCLGAESSIDRACSYYNCDTKETVWLFADGLELNAEQIASLEDCDKECELEEFQFVTCAAEAVGGVAIGDQILTIGLRDCDNVITTSTQYHVPTQTELTEPILTDQCDPDPQVEVVRDCILDVKGVEWVQISIIDPSDLDNPVVLYYNTDLALGTPEGDPVEWQSCGKECDDCDDCSLVTGVTGETQILFPSEVIPKTMNAGVIDPAVFEAAAPTTNDLSGLLDGTNTNLASDGTGQEDWLVRFDISSLLPEEDCATLVAVNVVSVASPGGAGWPVIAYNTNSLTPVFTDSPLGDGWWYQQYNGTNIINYGGHALQAGLPTPQASTGEYSITMPLDLAMIEDGQISFLNGVMTGGDTIRDMHLEVIVDYSACPIEEPKGSKRVVINTECQEKYGAIPVNISNETPILVQILEASSTTVVSPDFVCYPDSDGSNIVLQLITIIENPSGAVVSSDYKIVVLGTGTISTGLNIGDSFTPPDFFQLGTCGAGVIPETDTRTQNFCSAVDGTGYSVGDKILCQETFDITAGPIGSGDEVLLFTVYYTDSGTEVIFDPLTQSGPCPVENPVGKIVLPDACALVDGVNVYVSPVEVYDTVTGETVRIEYRDEAGALIVDTVEMVADCDCLDCNECSCPELLMDAPTQLDADGDPLPFPISFPYQTTPGDIQDFVFPFGLSKADCLDAADPASLIRVRFYFRDHDLVTGSNATNGFLFIIGDGSSAAQFVAESATNTFDNVTPTNRFGTSSAGVGSLLGSEDVADRWVDFDIPLQELIDGTTGTTSAFGGFPTGVTEELGNVYLTLKTDLAALGCDNC